jgi:TrpR-related protein YerC/YecD
MKKTDPNLANLKDLFQALLQLENIEECERFLADLCTPAELLSMADRWRAAQLLSQGVPYRSIYEKTGVSTATVTRVARALTYGEGGYQMILDRKKAKALPPALRKKDSHA